MMIILDQEKLSGLCLRKERHVSWSLYAHANEMTMAEAGQLC